MKEEDKIPAGSLPPEKDNGAEPEVVPELAEPRMYAGRFKSPEELEAGYNELQKMTGKQSEELGSLRKSTATLAEQIEQMNAKSNKSPDQGAPPDSPEMIIEGLATRYEAGDIGFKEAITKAMEMTATQAGQQSEAQLTKLREEMTGMFQNTLAERDAQAEVDKFKKQYPDYDEIVESDALDQIKADNPLLDDVAAYFAYKANVAAESAQEEAERVRKGSEVTNTVLKKPGSSIQQENVKKTLDPAELKRRLYAGHEQRMGGGS